MNERDHGSRLVIGTSILQPTMYTLKHCVSLKPIRQIKVAIKARLPPNGSHSGSSFNAKQGGYYILARLPLLN